MQHPPYGSDPASSKTPTLPPRQAGPYPEAPRQRLRPERQPEIHCPVQPQAPLFAQLEHCLEDLLRDW